jgi:hypothetical protein
MNVGTDFCREPTCLLKSDDRIGSEAETRTASSACLAHGRSTSVSGPGAARPVRSEFGPLIGTPSLWQQRLPTGKSYRSGWRGRTEGTPPEIIERLTREITAGLIDSAIRAQFVLWVCPYGSQFSG